MESSIVKLMVKDMSTFTSYISQESVHEVLEAGVDFWVKQGISNVWDPIIWGATIHSTSLIVLKELGPI